MLYIVIYKKNRDSVDYSLSRLTVYPQSDYIHACCLVISRVSMLMHAKCDIVMANLSVCPSVCLSNAGTLSKRMDISHCFDCLVEASF